MSVDKKIGRDRAGTFGRTTGGLFSESCENVQKVRF